MPAEMTPVRALVDYRHKNPHNVHLIAEFCGASPETVKRWSDKRQPKGEFLLRLEVLMTTLGYSLSSRGSDYDVVRYMARLVAFRLVTPEGALQYFEIKRGGDSYLWQVFRGSITPLYVKAKKITLTELEEAYDTDLSTKRDELLCSFGVQSERQKTSLVPTLILPPVEEVIPEPPDIPPVSGPPPSPSVTMAAGAILNCLPFLKALDIPNNPDVGAQVRSLIGSDNFFDILDMLKSMSSREASRYFRQSNTH